MVKVSQLHTIDRTHVTQQVASHVAAAVSQQSRDQLDRLGAAVARQASDVFHAWIADVGRQMRENMNEIVKQQARDAMKGRTR